MMCYSYLEASELAKLMIGLSKSERQRILHRHRTIDQEKEMYLDIDEFFVAMGNGCVERVKHLIQLATHIMVDLQYYNESYHLNKLEQALLQIVSYVEQIGK